MNNKYISKYAKHDTHFLRTSDKNYYFEEEPKVAAKVFYSVCFILCLIGLLFLATI